MTDQQMPDDDPQIVARRRAAERIGLAARTLIDTANAAAQATVNHEDARAHPAEMSKHMFAIAQTRRQAEQAAVEALQAYIDTVAKNATRG